MSNCTQKLRVHGTLVARILMGGFFLLAGVGKLMNGADNVAAYISSQGLPMATLLAWLTIILEIVAGAAIVVGKKTSKAAMALIVFTILASVLFHEISLDDTMFMKNLAIIAGLLYIAAYGPGDGWSLAHKKAGAMPSTPSGDMQ